MKWYSSALGLHVDFSNPISLANPLMIVEKQANAFHIAQPKWEPLKVGAFIGSVEEGGSCNCENLTLNAHGNGTHTECVGHITKDRYAIFNALKSFMCTAVVIRIQPTPIGDDNVVTLEMVKQTLGTERAQAIVMACSGLNEASLFTKNWSGTNPPYLSAELTTWLANEGFDHLLIDLPSVDREEDGGKLSAHHAWWNYPTAPRMHATITELIVVPDDLKSGKFLLQMQVAPLGSDASPSWPILYPLF